MLTAMAIIKKHLEYAFKFSTYHKKENNLKLFLFEKFFDFTSNETKKKTNNLTTINDHPSSVDHDQHYYPIRNMLMMIESHVDLHYGMNLEYEVLLLFVDRNYYS